MKKYNDNQKVKKEEVVASGVACDEKDCDGEMMIIIPEQIHPELGFKRARCSVCGWLGWV